MCRYLQGKAVGLSVTGRKFLRRPPTAYYDVKIVECPMCENIIIIIDRKPRILKVNFF